MIKQVFKFRFMEEITMTEKEEFQSFWDLLVPPKGKAETVQGEVIRIAGRIEYEFLDNGCINWDEDFKKMLDAFLRYVQLGNGFSGDDLSSAELLVHLLKDNGDKGFIDDNLTQYYVAVPSHG